MHHKKAWLAALGTDQPEKLGKRIAWDGLDSRVLELQWNKKVAQAGQDSNPWPTLDAEHDSPNWLPALQICSRVLQNHWNDPLLPYDPKCELPFVDLWWPICCYWSLRLQEELAYLPSDCIMKEQVINQLSNNLLERLCYIGERVLWQVFSANRTPGVMLLAHLGEQGDCIGPPIRNHYETFIRTHRCDGLTHLLKEYPGLGRLIGIAVRLWEDQTKEMLCRIYNDRKVLASRFNLSPDHLLSSVKQGLSDPHRGGRTVSILRFTIGGAESNGKDVLIVYKPKDLRVDNAYQKFLDDLNASGLLPPLETLCILVANGYGYMEFVPHKLCANKLELEKFYINAGRQAAVLYALGCTDCHHENLIACGEQLLLIDAETLLEPDIPDHILEAGSQTSPSAPSLLQERLNCSVLRTGLLPQWMYLGAAKRPIDISSLGATSPLELTRSKPGWLGVNSDGMMPGRVTRATSLATSSPVGIGIPNAFHQYLDQFCTGFESQCLLLLNLRQQLLSVNGALSRFCGLPRRIVLRATRVYYMLQQQMLGPYALQSQFAQTMVLEQLARSFLIADTRPIHWPVLASEVRQMKLLDIPFFTHQVDGDVLYLDQQPALCSMDTSLNSAELSGFIRTSGLAAARKRLQRLSSEDIAFQLRLIRGVSAAFVSGTSQTDDPERTEISGDISFLVEPTPGINSLEAARRVANQLLDLAIVDPSGEIEWLGMNLGEDGVSFRYGTVGASLYGGSIGIACFLKRLQALSVVLSPKSMSDQRFLNAKVVVKNIIQPLHKLVDDLGENERICWWRDQPLGINGCGGVLLGLQLLGEQELVDVLIKGAIARFLQKDNQLDLLGGCAGLIGSLLRQRCEAAQMIAVAAGEILLQQQNTQGAWGRTDHQLGYCGFSHGAAGFASALARLHQSTGDDRYRTAAAAALGYERSFYNRQRKNWPDNRNTNTDGRALTGTVFTTSWCHGAPGIALARACLWGTALWDEQCIEEMEAALTTTAALGQLDRDHICCGNLGIMAILELLGEGPWPLNPGLRTLCNRAAQRHRHMALVRCGNQSTDTMQLRSLSTDQGILLLPGFFNGLSGMGLAILEDMESRKMLALLLTAGLWPDL